MTEANRKRYSVKELFIQCKILDCLKIVSQLNKANLKMMIKKRFSFSNIFQLHLFQHLVWLKISCQVDLEACFAVVYLKAKNVGFK